jgi:predicted metal-dependent peptidase
MGKAEKLLEKAKIQLILNEPFFAACALKIGYIENATIETCRTNGKVLQYNPSFICSFPLEIVRTLIAHEVMHVVLLHPLRTGNKDKKIWNMACDYAINPMLRKSGFKLPVGSLLNTDFENMSAEEIYKILMNQKPDNENQNGSGNGRGMGENSPESFGEVEQPEAQQDLKELEQEIEQMTLQAYNTAKQAGKAPAFIEEIIKDLLNPKKDWRLLLQKYVAEMAKNDYTWTKPNPRYMPMGLYLLALQSIEIGKVVFVIDTSGSVDLKLLQEFASEIKEASTLFSMPVTIIHCDTKVQKVEEYTDQDSINPVGRGGTEFQPAFDYVNENIEDAKAIVYFTDGQSWGKYHEPNVPVLWCIYNNKNFKCPFGEIINIENK